MGQMKINLSQAFAGQKVGVRQVEDKIAENPFAAKLLPMSPV